MKIPNWSEHIPHWKIYIVIFFATYGIGLLAMGFSRLPLVWDGSYYLLKILVDQSFFVPNNRFANIPLQIPTLLAESFTHNISILTIVFSISYVLPPLFCLYLCWRICRNHFPILFIWPVLSMALANFSNQINFTSETNLLIGLTWVALLIILRSVPYRLMSLLVFIFAMIFFCHPFSIFSFALLLIVLTPNLFSKSMDRKLLVWSIIIFFVIITNVLWFVIFHSQYETDNFSLQTFVKAYDYIMISGALRLFFCCLTVACLIFVSHILMIFGKTKTISNIVNVIGAIFIIVSVSLLLHFFTDSLVWKHAINVKTFSFFIALPFWTLCAIENFLLQKKPDWTNVVVLKKRLIFISIIGLCSLMVSLMAIDRWQRMTKELEHAIDQSTTSCISLGSMPVLLWSVVDHWSISSLSLLLQNKEPTKMIVQTNPHQNVLDAAQKYAINITSWDSLKVNNKNFNYSKLYANLLKEYSSECVSGSIVKTLKQ